MCKSTSKDFEVLFETGHLIRLHLLHKLRCGSVKPSPEAFVRVAFRIFESAHTINKESTPGGVDSLFGASDLTRLHLRDAQIIVSLRQAVATDLPPAGQI